MGRIVIACAIRSPAGATLQCAARCVVEIPEAAAPFSEFIPVETDS